MFFTNMLIGRDFWSWRYGGISKNIINSSCWLFNCSWYRITSSFGRRWIYIIRLINNLKLLIEKKVVKPTHKQHLNCPIKNKSIFFYFGVWEIINRANLHGSRSNHWKMDKNIYIYHAWRIPFIRFSEYNSFVLQTSCERPFQELFPPICTFCVRSSYFFAHFSTF